MPTYKPPPDWSDTALWSAMFANVVVESLKKNRINFADATDDFQRQVMKIARTEADAVVAALRKMLKEEAS